MCTCTVLMVMFDSIYFLVGLGKRGWRWGGGVEMGRRGEDGEEGVEMGRRDVDGESSM